MKLKTLCGRVGNTEPGEFEDFMLIIAKNIEGGLTAMGAEAGKDYTYKDLADWTMPFVLRRMEQLTINCDNF